MPLDPWLRDNLACPRHHAALTPIPRALACAAGCRFPVVDDVPVMLLDDVTQTIGLAQRSLELATVAGDGDPLFIDSLGISDEEKAGVRALAARADTRIDPVASFLVGATNGIAYKSLIGVLTEYPIPELRLPPGHGQSLLDIGCSWGRWTIAAARRGYRPVAIDPSLGAVMAARRVAKACGVEARFVVGDARFLPFRPAALDRVFSYSVIQHFSRDDAARTAREIGRVLSDDGSAFIQMPTTNGVRCLYHQFRRGFRDGVDFEVRYWTLPALRRLFSSAIGPTAISVDCFFGIGLQASDRPFMPPMLRTLVSTSELLRRASTVITPLRWAADSVYVQARRSPRPGPLG